MDNSKRPPSYGVPTGPIMFADHCEISSPAGPAEQLAGASVFISAISDLSLAVRDISINESLVFKAVYSTAEIVSTCSAVSLLGNPTTKVIIKLPT